MPQASIKRIFNRDLESIFDVVTDFEKIPEFEPGVIKVKILENSKTSAKVLFHMKIMVYFKFVVKVDFNKKDFIHWELVESKLLKKNSGYWKLKSLGPHRTEVEYGCDLEINGVAPKFLIKKLVDQRLPEMMDNYHYRCQKSSQPLNNSSLL